MNEHVDPPVVIKGGVHTATRHDSAHKHVTGSALYADDVPLPAGALHAYLGLADCANGSITQMDLSAVRAHPGVVAVLTARDMPASNDISRTHLHDEPVLADGKVEFHGQPIFAVIAEDRECARLAAQNARITYDETDFARSVDEATVAEALDCVDLSPRWKSSFRASRKMRA